MESGSDNDLEDENFDEMEVLIINVLSPPSATFNHKNSETFFTLLGLVKKAEEMATNLANRSFSHSLFTISNVLLNYMNSVYPAYDPIDTNLFAYIATNQYLSDKFYQIMINTSASKHSTASYGQLMAYTRNIKNTANDIAKANIVYIQFGIGSISFIGSVIIQTPIGHMKFHIVKANTSFLLSLADINWLGVYFNNIHNLFVMKSMCIPIIRHFNYPFCYRKAV